MVTVASMNKNKKGASLSKVEKNIETVLDRAGVKRNKGYLILRNVILTMCNEPSLNIRESQDRVAKQSGLNYGQVRYAMEKAVKEANSQSVSVETKENGDMKVRAFVEYCVCKCQEL